MHSVGSGSIRATRNRLPVSARSPSWRDGCTSFRPEERSDNDYRPFPIADPQPVCRTTSCRHRHSGGRQIRALTGPATSEGSPHDGSAIVWDGSRCCPQLRVVRIVVPITGDREAESLEAGLSGEGFVAPSHIEFDVRWCRYGFRSPSAGASPQNTPVALACRRRPEEHRTVGSDRITSGCVKALGIAQAGEPLRGRPSAHP